MNLVIDSLRCTLFSEGGMPDEFGEAIITDDGLMLQGHLVPDCVGITWADLAQILDHPVIQEKLQEAELLAGPGIV